MDRQHNIQNKKTNRQTTIYKTQYRKLKIEQHEHHEKPWVNSGILEGQEVPVPLTNQPIMFKS